jgi:hypothetical protein
MTKQPTKKRRKAGKATNLGENIHSCGEKETCRRDFPIRVKPDLKVIPKGQCDEGAAKVGDLHLINGIRLKVSDRRERNITPRNKNCV